MKFQQGLRPALIPGRSRPCPLERTDMPRLNFTQQNAVREKTDEVLQTLLRFHVSYSGARYIHEEATVNWRDLEDRLHNDYPIRGVGIKATRNNLKVINAEFDGFLHQDEDLYPGEVPSELQSFPYQAASAAYAFTLLEGYGDDLVSIVNPGYLKVRQAWHHAVYGDANLRDIGQLAKAKEGLAKPFMCKANKVPKYVVQRLVEIKSVRNEFMHEGSSDIDFDDFFGAVVGTVAFLHFMVLPSENEITLYPYYDYHEKWS